MNFFRVGIMKLSPVLQGYNGNEIQMRNKPIWANDIRHRNLWLLLDITGVNKVFNCTKNIRVKCCIVYGYHNIMDRFGYACY